MEEFIYLGHGCLNTTVQKQKEGLLLHFETAQITTTMVVNIVDYDVICNHPHTKTSEESKEYEHGGDIIEGILNFFLYPGESCIVACNAQNQTDVYIKFINENNKLTWGAVATQHYGGVGFQGWIGDIEVDECTFNMYISFLQNIIYPTVCELRAAKILEVEKSIYGNNFKQRVETISQWFKNDPESAINSAREWLGKEHSFVMRLQQQDLLNKRNGSETLSNG